MIGKKINQLATELAPASTDLTIIGNPTTGVSKKITLAQLGAIFSGAVSFYTNYAAFTTPGTTDVIYCAKDTKKLYLWSGNAYVEVFPSQALLDTYQLRSEKGNANGYASLDSTGKVPISQLPSSIMEYKGTWSAATNTPTLANGTGDTGDVYICNAAGSVNFGAGAITFAVGDYVIYSGSIWQRSSGAVGTVTSVAASITGNAIGITGSPVTTSGTLALAFAGTSAQYVNGAGNLVTFPSIISQAQNIVSEVYNNTGATLTKGTIVYINGGQGNLPTVTKALATSDSTSAQTYGIVQADITNMNNGYVVVTGRLIDLDTQAYSNGTQLYLSGTTAGTWTSIKPYAPIHLVYVGIVVRSHPTQGVVEVKIQNGYELDEIHNVAAQTPTNNDGLFWEASTSLWKNKSIATVLGYTPQAQLNGTGFVKASGTTITYDNSTYLTTSAAATTYLPMVLSSTAKSIELNGQTFDVSSVAGSYTSGRLIVTPTFTAIGYQSSGVFKGLQIATDGTANFFNTGLTRFYNQVQFDSTLTNGTYTYTLPGATGTLALTSDLTGGTVTSVGLSSATSGVTIGSTPITTSGTITLAIATASGSQQGLLSSTDWTTFNNKQNALTNPVTGTGTTNYLPKFTGTSTIGNSLVYDNGVGIGINTNSISAVLDVNTAGSSIRFGDKATVSNDINVYYRTTGIARNDIGGGGTFTWGISGGSENMRLNASGNLGLGVTPSAWYNTYSALQLGPLGASISGRSDANTLAFTSNAYRNTSANWIYSGNNYALLHEMVNGTYYWFTAPSGTAGSAISFTQAMTLNASGNLSIGNTNDTYRLDVTGRGRFTHTGGVPALDIRASDSNFALMSVFGNQVGDVNWLIMSGYPAAGDFTIRQSDTVNALTLKKTTGAATFSSSVTAAQLYTNSNAGASGFLQFNYSSGNTSSRSWRLANDISVYGDFAIQQSTTQTGTTFANQLYINATGAATFSSSVTATSFTVGASANYNAMFYTAGANASYIQMANGSTGAGSGNGMIIGVDASGNGIVGVRGAFDYITSVAGVERMRISSNGNLGIGTTSPSDLLDIYASSGTPAIRLSGAGAGTNTYRITGQLIGVSNTGFGIYDNTNSTYRLVINGSGNVGIGTTSPSTKLEVNGAIKTGNPGLGSAGAIKLGQRFTGTAIGVGGYIPIDIDGTTYYINLATTTP